MVKDIELDELERAAYVAGDEQTLKLLARIAPGKPPAANELNKGEKA